MALTLEQYAAFLDTRDMSWPAPPSPQPPKAKAHLAALPGIRLVSWNIYGTLLSITSGGVFFTHPQKFIMDLALDKTVQEFKMWGSMSRKPGQPSEYMAEIYKRVLDEQRLAPSPGEKYPEILAERIWEAILKKLFQKDYKFDAGFFGSLNEYSKKVAYFFHASLQGTACYEGAARALEHVQSCGLQQAVLADGQCFTLVQLQRGLAAQSGVRLDDVLAKSMQALSCDVGGRKPSERLLRHFLQAAAQQGIPPGAILHIGSRIVEDIAPAKKAGLRTGLFAGDKESLQATVEQMKDPATRPDVLLTELSQVTELIARPDAPLKFQQGQSMPPQVHFDVAKLAPTQLVADKEAIRRVLPQRFEMEQLDAIVYVDAAAQLVVGYKDVRHDEFWVRGHMPGYPLMPGVLMCEAAAQLISYFVLSQGIMEGDFLGFFGMEQVRFRSPVRPGTRLHLVGKAIRMNRRQSTFNVQGFVNSTMVFEGDIIGVPLQRQSEA